MWTKNIYVAVHLNFVGKDKETFPLCYHCQNFKNERKFDSGIIDFLVLYMRNIGFGSCWFWRIAIKFHMVTQEQLCPEDCATCIGERDMPRAFECARKCQGLPTFCYPREYLMVHRKCYQAESWYGMYCHRFCLAFPKFCWVWLNVGLVSVIAGCDFFPVSPETSLTSECRDCANLTKNEKEAQECSVDCDGLPTYSKTDRNGKLTYISCKPAPPSKNFFHSKEFVIFCIWLDCKCKFLFAPVLVAYADLFLYEIPRFLMRHFQVSNPNTLYPADLILKLGTFGGFLRSEWFSISWNHSSFLSTRLSSFSFCFNQNSLTHRSTWRWWHSRDLEVLKINEFCERAYDL